uniref:Uncharacterized protein n=1 Tax=Babesia bovis TaxID=5865 RepID=S6BI23_BABBO|nr:hypothetical protein [Babesia bovis]
MYFRVATPRMEISVFPRHRIPIVVYTSPVNWKLLIVHFRRHHMDHRLVGIHTPSSSFLYAGLSQGDMVSQLSEQRSPYSSLRAELEACNLNEVKQVPGNIDDDSVLNGKLLFSAYANSLESTGILDGNHTAILDHVSDETRTKLEAAKIARLRSLNKTSVPIVVDTSRTLSSQESENCLTVSKLRFVGVVPASYQTTLEELLPRITGLLRGNIEQSPSSLRDVLCDYEVLTKRRGKPLSEDECQYNWVFQLDFFDRDDPLFRRAVYTSHRIIESDRSRLRSAVSYTIQQLERSRVLYIQMRFNI